MQLDVNRWMARWAEAGLRAPREAEAAFELLARHYAEPARHYHTAAHIVDCLTRVDDARKQLSDPVAVELASWFHDAVYDSRATDNEECSATLAAEVITGAGGTPLLVARVRALILATRTHEPGAGPDAPWLIDIDLAILGQPADVFATYETAIRAEYAWVEPAVFCAKRAQVLAGFLARPQIYLTPFFRERWEVAARANLQRSLDRLRNGRLPG